MGDKGLIGGRRGALPASFVSSLQTGGEYVLQAQEGTTGGS